MNHPLPIRFANLDDQILLSADSPWVPSTDYAGFMMASFVRLLSTPDGIEYQARLNLFQDAIMGAALKLSLFCATVLAKHIERYDGELSYDALDVGNADMGSLPAALLESLTPEDWHALADEHRAPEQLEGWVLEWLKACASLAPRLQLRRFEGELAESKPASGKYYLYQLDDPEATDEDYENGKDDGHYCVYDASGNFLCQADSLEHAEALIKG